MRNCVTIVNADINSHVSSFRRAQKTPSLTPLSSSRVVCVCSVVVIVTVVRVAFRQRLSVRPNW